MVERPQLSRGETAVARALWDLKQGTVRQVHAALPASPPMEFSTVQTYLRRLEQKGYVAARLEGRVRVYRAKVRPTTVIRRTIDDLVERMFGGETLPLVRHLIEERGLSDDELAELKRMIERLE